MTSNENLSARLRGVSKDLFLWASKSSILKKIFTNIDSAKLLNQLCFFLGDNEEAREHAALDLYKLIWGNHAEFGPLPTIELLTQFEHDRVFYKNYRDHTTHTVRTFLIGLYIYECNTMVQKAVNNYLLQEYKTTLSENEDIFIFIWSLTALYHDIGYIIENNKIDLDIETKKQTINCINSTLQYPLSHTARFLSQISEEKEGYIIDQYKIYVTRISSINSIEENDLFEKLLNASTSTSLALNEENGIKLYYSFANSHKTKDGREGFRDHGICSALLLLKTWFSFSDYIKAVCKEEKCPRQFGEIGNEIFELNRNLISYAPFVICAAEAISLHNINKDIWNLSDAIAQQLNFDQFCIYLKNSDTSHKRLPVAFLLRLCDEIQMWDRPYFRAVNNKDVTLHNEDISLLVSANGVYLRFFADENRFLHPDSDIDGYFCKLKASLNKYLNLNSLDEILKYGTPEYDESRHVDSISQSIEETSVAPFEVNELNNSEQSDKILDTSDWLVGAVNLDEDVHFSSFYLFQSLSCNLPPEYQDFGYNNIIAIYNDYNETYYIPKDECISISKRLIDAGEKDIAFWDSLFSDIKKRIQDLEEVFSSVHPNTFAQMSISDLYQLYKNHNAVHKRLYVSARIPEALDRGNSTFTNYLKDYLRTLDPALQDDATLNSVFEVLTYPENLSYSGQEIVELYDLICQIRDHDNHSATKTFSATSSRILINMDSEIRNAIQKYSNKWAFWGYHGYRNRAIRDFNYFVEKLKVDVKSNRIDEQSKKLQADLERMSRQKVLYFSQYDIDYEHKVLFKVFSKIGTLKIYRRYVQLINFYYLDMLISEIAQRFSTSESVIRCMLPNEVEELLNGNQKTLQKGIERSTAKIFAVIFSNGSYNIVCGDSARQLYSKLKEKTQQSMIQRGQLQGDPVSKGTVRGIGRILSAENKKNFERGNILVCVDTDPDLFEYMKMAGAVLAESGGLTCHAAIVCRELRIPCIVRIPGLLDSIHDGDIIDVDANIGQIKIATSISNNIIKSLYCTKNMKIPHNIGRKAFGLMHMKCEGINVPDFICIPINLLNNLFKEIEADGKGAESQALITELNIALDEIDAPFYAVRSSTSAEDLEDFSGAGQEYTRLHVSADDVIFTIESILNDMDVRKRKVGGSIIVQRMIFGEISGVMFTHNPLDDQHDTNEIIIETVLGGNEHLTSGLVSPTRYKIIDGKYELEQRGDKWGGECSSMQLHLLEKEGRLIENLFKAPQDIEWTIAENKLYILQSRDITGNIKVDENLILKNKMITSQLCISIYQNYALPQVLQNHMLRVAGVGKWIIDRWNNPNIKLNEDEIIEALLLHDIGNIVKGDDENFRSLFPDTYTMESFDYWINVRRWVREHYGKTDTEATQNIVREIGVNSRILELIEKKQFVNNELTFTSTNFAIKICAYADQRVSPDGIMSLTGRLNEAKKRYQGVKGASVNSPNYKSLFNCAIKIEEQIFKHVKGTPDMITDASIEGYMIQLKNHKFKNLKT